MLSPRRRSSLVAALATFGALYAVLGLIPLSELVFQQGFLTASKLIAPLIGMLFGPYLGGLMALIGDFIDVAFSRISLDAFGVPVMASDLSIVATAGLAFSGHKREAMLLPIAILALFVLDPITIQTRSAFPFVWFHLVAFAALGGALLLESRKVVGRLSPLFVAGVTFGAQLCGQLTGTVVGEVLQVQVYGVFTPATWAYRTSLVLWIYPVERTLFAVLGIVIALPVLRSILRSRPQEPTASG